MDETSIPGAVTLGDVLGELTLQHGLPPEWTPQQAVVVVSITNQRGEDGTAVLLTEGLGLDDAARSLSLGLATVTHDEALPRPKG